MGQLLLGIDIGTYSSKGVLCSPDGTILAEARADHEMSIPKPGYAEHDADGDMVVRFQTDRERTSGKMPRVMRLPRVGVSAIGACVLPVDKDGKPLRPGILYGVDTRAVSQIEELEKKYSRECAG